jgi:alkylation response protein AidB-like acyl-CoA dehydrogenase
MIRSLSFARRRTGGPPVIARSHDLEFARASIADLPSEVVEFRWSPDDVAYREELLAFMAEQLPADWESLSEGGPGSDVQAAFSRQFCAKLAERGWLTQSWPAEFGGRDAPPWRHAILGEEMWACGEPRGPQYMNVNWIGPTIMEYGSPAQKELHLPLISRGDVLWCQGFSEPEAGSDLVALRTLAIRDGDDYVVNGTKIWTSYANHAQYCFLLVRSDPASKRHRGISILLVPMDLPGIEVREIPSVVGERYFHEVFFDDVRVPVDCRLGPEHEGWDVVSYSLQYERVGAARYARAARMLDALADHADRSGLLEDPTVLEKLGEARAACEASRMLTYRVIDLRAHGSPPTADTNIARVAGTLAERAVADLALDLYGAEALVHGSFADAHFRLAMTAGVAVGTTEVNLNLVASRFLGLPRE